MIQINLFGGRQYRAHACARRQPERPAAVKLPRRSHRQPPSQPDEAIEKVLDLRTQ